MKQLDGRNDDVCTTNDDQGDSGSADVVKRKVYVGPYTLDIGSFALGVIRRLHELGQLKMVFCTETRPYNQIAHLTVYELVVTILEC